MVHFIIYSTIRSSLRGSDFSHGVLSREVKSGYASRSRGVEEIQAVHTSKLGRLAEGEVFFAQVMDCCDQTHLSDKLPRLFAESEEKIVGNIYGDVE